MIKLHQVDAFTAKPFGGNPAAVCVLPAPRDERWMQSFAAEMNLSETAFLHRRPDQANLFGLRWFTPRVEVDLCGHATLASAWALWESGEVERGHPIRFGTKSGELGATLEDGWVRLDFPADPATPVDAPEILFEALGCRSEVVARSRTDLLVELESEVTLRSLRPDFRLLGQVPVRGIIVTAPPDVAGIDFVSRFFAPASGIGEDPVTGSAHCTLGPWWSERLGLTEMTARQVSERGGTVKVRLVADRIHLLGQAVTIFSGALA